MIYSSDIKDKRIHYLVKAGLKLHHEPIEKFRVANSGQWLIKTLRV
jgi:hypothetical protein